MIMVMRGHDQCIHYQTKHLQLSVPARTWPSLGGIVMTSSIIQCGEKYKGDLTLAAFLQLFQLSVRTAGRLSEGPATFTMIRTVNLLDRRLYLVCRTLSVKEVRHHACGPVTAVSHVMQSVCN